MPAKTLHEAAEKNDHAAAEALLKAGANPNLKDSAGELPLHYAAEKGHLPLIELLISKGADVNAKNRYNKTALERAQARNQTAAAELLLSKGAVPEVKKKKLDDDASRPNAGLGKGRQNFGAPTGPGRGPAGGAAHGHASTGQRRPDGGGKSGSSGS